MFRLVRRDGDSLPRNVKNRCFRHSAHFLCHKIGFNRLHAVSSHETETGNHWKMADSVIRSVFFRVGRVARNVETLVFRISWQCIRSRNAFHLCAKPFGTYRNVWSWNGFDDIKQHATEGWNRFDQAVTASGATMQAGPDSLAETKTAGEARKDSSFRGCSSSDGCWHGDCCLTHGDYGADGCRRI